jgi:hypothetical protein
MTLENLIRDLSARGVVFEPVGDKLRVDPVERLKPHELDAIRRCKKEILSLFASGRLVVVACPGEDCAAVLCVFDGIAFCKAHAMTIRFVERPQ